MDNHLYERVKDYKIAVSVAREMLSTGIISEEDFGIICTVLAEKFGVKLSSIFAEIAG